MTQQVPDSCFFDGKQWNIDEWRGSFDGIPSSEAMGLKTIYTSTANYSGRIDHYLVFKNQLYLFKIEAELANEDSNFCPIGARREVRTIYEPIEINDKNGKRIEERVHIHRYFIFDDIKIELTGELTLSHPIGDPWDYPWPISEDDLLPTESVQLKFKKGQMIESKKLNILRQ